MRDLKMKTLAASITLAMAVLSSPSLFAQTAPVKAATLASDDVKPIVTLPDFTKLVEDVGPSVVNIRTMEKVRMRPALNNGDILDLFRQFGLPVPNRPQPGQNRDGAQQPDSNQKMPEREVPRGIGSGFIITSDGYILTNAHVVKGASEVLVTLSDKREFKAKIIGIDTRSDIAVVKIEAKNLPAVKVGDTNKLKVGQWAIAIGSPFGLSNTVTQGIVSATQRDTGQYMPFIQTDVPINPGNSGGPLINMQGQVIGINSMIYSSSGGSMGISFSIPIDEAIRVSNQLRENGYVTRGKIGVMVEGLSEDTANALGLKASDGGALVAKVESDSAAAKAGVKAGDIILKFNGVAIERSTDLPRIVGETKPGAKVPMIVFRTGKMMTLPIVLGEMESDKTENDRLKEKNNKDGAKKGSGAFKNYGLTVINLSSDEKEQLKISGGVKVDQVSGSSAVSGLQPGDIILQIKDSLITSVDQFDSIVQKWPKDSPMPVLVRRGGTVTFLTLRAMLP